MAIGTPTLFGSGAGTTSAATSSATPTANALLIAFCAARQGGATIPTISDSLGGTWTAVHTDSDQDAGVVVANLFYQVVSGSPAAMTVTAASTGATQTGIHVVEITGAGTDFTNFQFNINGSGDPAVTMASFSTGGICLGFLAGNAGGGATTPPTGHTELLDSLITTNLRMDSSYDTSSPGTSLTWSSASTDSVGYGLEIMEPSSGTQNITGALFTDSDTFFGATIGRGAVAITGALYTDTDTFYGSTVGRGTVTISGALYSDADAFYGATIAPGGVTITGALYTDADTFYGATIVADGGPQDITGDLYTNTSIFHSATVSSPAPFVVDEMDMHDGISRAKPQEAELEKYRKRQRAIRESLEKHFTPEQPEPQPEPVELTPPPEPVPLPKSILQLLRPKAREIVKAEPELDFTEVFRELQAAEIEKRRREDDEIAFVLLLH